jgi:hypothetical protein
VHVAAYIEVLQETAAKPSVKLHLAAIRMLFEKCRFFGFVVRSSIAATGS